METYYYRSQSLRNTAVDACVAHTMPPLWPWPQPHAYDPYICKNEGHRSVSKKGRVWTDRWTDTTDRFILPATTVGSEPSEPSLAMNIS